jgi:hypothetical protein
MSDRTKFINDVTDTVRPYFPKMERETIEKITRCLIFRENQFSYELVRSYQYLCVRCGQCCIKACIDFDPETNLCKGYQTRPIECKQWPYWKVDGREGIYCDVYCNYSFRMVVKEVVKYIEGLDEVPDIPETKETFII